MNEVSHQQLLSNKNAASQTTKIREKKFRVGSGTVTTEAQRCIINTITFKGSFQGHNVVIEKYLLTEYLLTEYLLTSQKTNVYLKRL